ncbi:MAG: hypothetical protein KAT26_11745 [Marinosulfonomonas sp.]|nr:hypothetical protein [Marinosulfonomonas sp.]
MKRLFASLLIVCGLTAGGAYAGSLYPEVPKAVGAAHPEGNAYMRINHMRLLRHDRDETMRLGNRDTEYSLSECVACHAVQGPDALPISVKEEGHFCRSCHEYAAVKIDCFQCHNSKPDEGFTALLLQSPAPSESDIAAYLDGVTQ